jgi:phosphatidylglycerophosphate synthase
MTIPAVIVCEPPGGELKVAGLPLIDRLVIAAHRAKAGAITVVAAQPWPVLERAAALGVPVTFATTCPRLTGPTLVLSDRLLVQPPDLRRLIERSGRLVSREGRLLPAGVLTAREGRRWEEQWADLPAVTAEGVAEPVSDGPSAARAARALWAAQTSSADGWVDEHFNRPIGRHLSKLLVHTRVSPNEVSLAATLLGLVAAACFAQGDYSSALWGALLLQVSAIIDCVDGDLARILFKESRSGQWLDFGGDQVVHLGVFAGIGWGLYRAGGGETVLALAASAVIGVVMSFAVVLHGRLNAGARRNTRLQALIDATTNRDFSVLILVLAAAGRLPWFLWMAAIGVHLFWMAALSVQWMHQPVPAVLKAEREGRS